MADINDTKELIDQIGEDIKEMRENYSQRLDQFEERMDQLETALKRPGAGGDLGGGTKVAQAQDALARWAKGDTKALTGGDSSGDQKDLVAGNDPSGGIFVPEPVQQEIVRALREESAIRQGARVFQVQQPRIEVPFEHQSVTSSWTAETQQPPRSSPQLGTLTIETHNLSVQARATANLLEDASINVAQWLQDQITAEFSEVEGEAFVTGTGVNKPRGLLTYPFATTDDGEGMREDIQVVDSGKSGGIDPDKLFTAAYTPHRRFAARAVWLMNRKTAAYIRTFKDQNGQYLWQPGLQGSQPDSLLGFPVRIDDHFPDPVTGAVPLVLADLRSGYAVVDRVSMGMTRDPYTEAPFTRFIARRRVGGHPLDLRAIKGVRVE